MVKYAAGKSCFFYLPAAFSYSTGTESGGVEQQNSAPCKITGQNEWIEPGQVPHCNQARMWH